MPLSVTKEKVYWNEVSMGFLNIFLEYYSTISINVFVCVVLAGRMGVKRILVCTTLGANVMKVMVAAVFKSWKENPMEIPLL